MFYKADGDSCNQSLVAWCPLCEIDITFSEFVRDESQHVVL